MPLNNSQQAIIDNRRRQVAALRLRGLTQREIVNGLLTQGLINPDTGEAWSLGTINSDIKALSEEWKRQAMGDISDHKARQFAELQEVKRAAWGGKDLPVVLRALKQESELLGTDAPEKLEHRGSGSEPLVIKVVYGERTNHSPAEPSSEAG